MKNKIIHPDIEMESLFCVAMIVEVNFISTLVVVKQNGHYEKRRKKVWIIYGCLPRNALNFLLC